MCKVGITVFGKAIAAHPGKIAGKRYLRIAQINRTARKHKLVRHERGLSPALPHQDTWAFIPVAYHDHRCGIADLAFVDGH